MFDENKTILVIVDVQQKLTNVMHDKEKMVRQLSKLIEGIKVLQVPIILTEQNPDGLGVTISEIKTLLPNVNPLPKMSFSCLGEEAFLSRLKESGRNQAILTGIEAHVCVYQTAMDLAGSGYDVQVVSDCISSRTQANKELALKKMCDAGIGISSVEMMLFELLKKADDPKFKPIARIIK